MIQANSSKLHNVSSSTNLCSERDKMCNKNEHPPTSETATQNSDSSNQLFSPDESTKGKAEIIQEGLEKTINKEAKRKIDDILREITFLSDTEKVVLYMKLPTGVNQYKDPPAHSANRTEQFQAITWIKSHLEEDATICLQKQDVYEDYKSYCESHGLKNLGHGDFGKVMKVVFPNVKPRRLGARGQSKHCHGGLKKTIQVASPSLPVLEKKLPQEDKKDDSANLMNDTTKSSCKLVLEWAQKLFPDKRDFENLTSLALHLIHDRLVSTRSPAAFTVLASANNGNDSSIAQSTIVAHKFPTTNATTGQLSDIKVKPSLTLNCNTTSSSFSLDSNVTTTSYQYRNGSTESVSAPTTPVKARGAISNTQIQKGTVSMIRKRIQERESLKGQKIILEQQQTEIREQYNDLPSNPSTPTTPTAPAAPPLSVSMKSQPHSTKKVTITSLLDEDDSVKPELTSPSPQTSKIRHALSHVGDKIQVKTEPVPPRSQSILGQLNSIAGITQEAGTQSLRDLVNVMPPVNTPNVVHPSLDSQNVVPAPVTVAQSVPCQPVNMSQNIPTSQLSTSQHIGLQPINMSQNFAEQISQNSTAARQMNLGQGVTMPINLSQGQVTIAQNNQVGQTNFVQVNQGPGNLNLISPMTSPASTPFTSPLNSPRVMNPIVNAFNLGAVSAAHVGPPITTVTAPIQTTAPAQYIMMQQPTIADAQPKLIIVSPQTAAQPAPTNNLQTILQMPMLPQSIKLENGCSVSAAKPPQQLQQALLHQQIPQMTPQYSTQLATQQLTAPQPAPHANPPVQTLTQMISQAPTSNSTVVQTLASQSTNQELTQPLINYLKQLGLNDPIISQIKAQGLTPHVLDNLMKLEQSVQQSQQGTNQQKKERPRVVSQNRTVSSILKDMRCNNPPPIIIPEIQKSGSTRTPVSQLLKKKRDKPPTNLRSLSLQNSPVGFNYSDSSKLPDGNACDISTIDVASRLAQEQQFVGPKQKTRHRSASAAVSSQPSAWRQQLMISRRNMQQEVPSTSNGTNNWEKLFMQSFATPQQPKEIDKKSAALASTLTSDIQQSFLSNLKSTDATGDGSANHSNDVQQILEELQQSIAIQNCTGIDTMQPSPQGANSEIMLGNLPGAYASQQQQQQPGVVDVYNRSAASTPASVLSPGGSIPSRSCGPSPTVDPGGNNVFTPINISSYQTAVTPDTILRPQAQRQQNNIDTSDSEMITLPTNSVNLPLGMNNTSGFVDCNQPTQDKFAPVSSIRPPVKRMSRGARGGPNSKRSRHHSASAVTNKSKMQVLNLPSYQTVQGDNAQTMVQTNANVNNVFTFSQANPLLSPSAQTPFIVMNGAAGDQPYSPEMNDIMGTNDAPMGNATNPAYRSQSVPVPEQPFRAFESDLLSLGDSQQNDIDLFMNSENGLNLQQVNNVAIDGAGCNARRDITSLLLDKPRPTQQVATVTNNQTDMTLFDSNSANQILLDEQLGPRSDPMVSGLDVSCVSNSWNFEKNKF